MSENNKDIAPGWYVDGAGQRRWWDGDTWTDWIDTTPHGAENIPRADALATAMSGETNQSELWQQRAAGLGLVGKFMLFGLPSLVLAGAGALFAIALLTAEEWTVVDIPAHAETFRTEQYFTGFYDVIDNGVSPCYVGQNWYECRNRHVDEYNRECANRELTEAGITVCAAYLEHINRMESLGAYGLVVKSLGGYGYLRSEQEIGTRQVGNGDYRPAVTHQATCYLGFLGECPD